MGKTVVCHNCRMTFKIGELRPPFDWEPKDLAEDSWIGVEPPAERKELHHCIMCETPLEEGVIVCPSCGMNQITGIQARRRYNAGAETKLPWWRRLSLPYVLFLLCLVVIAFGGYWLVVSLRRSAAALAREMALQSIVNEATRYLAEEGDPYGFEERFGGKVTDQNLPYFVKKLSAGKRDIQHAAALLIGCGDIQQLTPLLTLAISEQMLPRVREALEAIGPERLVELSVAPEKNVRDSAAVALCLLFGFERLPDTLEQLSAYGPIEDKIRMLNEMCRPWPEASGEFRLTMDGRTMGGTVRVQQYGTLFYLYIGSGVFRTSLKAPRRFTIPIARWCAATAPAVDPKRIRGMVGGRVELASPLGVGWEGTVSLTAKRADLSELPGFVPPPPAAVGETVEARLILERIR